MGSRIKICAPPCYVTQTLKKIERGLERANIIDYQYKEKNKKSKHVEIESAETVVAENTTYFVFLRRMLNQNDDGTNVTKDSGEGTNESDDNSLSDE